MEIDDYSYISKVTMQVGGMACIIKWIDWYIDDVMVQSQPPNFIAHDQVWAPFIDMAEYKDNICSNLTIYAGIRFLEQDLVLSNHFTYFKNVTSNPNPGQFIRVMINLRQYLFYNELFS